MTFNSTEFKLYVYQIVCFLTREKMFAEAYILKTIIVFIVLEMTFFLEKTTQIADCSHQGFL